FQMRPSARNFLASAKKLKSYVARTPRPPFSGPGQLNPKAAACAQGGFQAHAPSHAFDPLAHNGQADTGPAVGRSVKALKDAEDPSVMLGGDADAVILQPQADGVRPFLGPKADLRPHLQGDKTQGIAQQIGQHLA